MRESTLIATSNVYKEDVGTLTACEYCSCLKEAFMTITSIALVSHRCPRWDRVAFEIIVQAIDRLHNAIVAQNDEHPIAAVNSSKEYQILCELEWEYQPIQDC